MNLNEEAKRIMALSISKLYSSRTQRGGLRLHRSLLLSLVMRSARDIYHSVQLLNETAEQQQHTVPCEPQESVIEEPMDTTTDQTVPDVSIESTETDPMPDEEADITPVKTEDGEWDKENRDWAQCERHSRKRRGKAAAEPEFLPSKKARMDTEDDRRVGVLRSSNGNCCRSVEIITQISVPSAIEAF
ncbi:immediate early response 2b [Sardina pilchardus]|uniref:immediate early response 2b n=1 Tax=Sardina pilchardus TaxID=27697 RepID=UPI002E14AB18